MGAKQIGHAPPGVGLLLSVHYGMSILPFCTTNWLFAPSVKRRQTDTQLLGTSSYNSRGYGYGCIPTWRLNKWKQQKCGAGSQDFPTGHTSGKHRTRCASPCVSLQRACWFLGQWYTTALHSPRRTTTCRYRRGRIAKCVGEKAGKAGNTPPEVTQSESEILWLVAARSTPSYETKGIPL